MTGHETTHETAGRPDDLAWSVIGTPVGPLTAVVSERGVRAVLWPDDDAIRVPDAGRLGDGSSRRGGSRPQAAILRAIATQLDEYFHGSRTEFDLPLDPIGTDFQRRAWVALRDIPYGQTVSYGQQAERMGDRNMARAVGSANGKNPISIIVPCHRVVGRNGSLTGFAGGLETKRKLIEHERRVVGVTLL